MRISMDKDEENEQIMSAENLNDRFSNETWSIYKEYSDCFIGPVFPFQSIESLMKWMQLHPG